MECDVLAAIVEWRENPADQIAKAPSIAKRLETAMDKLFGIQSRALVSACHTLADSRLQECGVMLVKVWEVMGETVQANALRERLEEAKKREEQLVAVMDSCWFAYNFIAR